MSATTLIPARIAASAVKVSNGVVPTVIGIPARWRSTPWSTHSPHRHWYSNARRDGLVIAKERFLRFVGFLAIGVLSL